MLKKIFLLFLTALLVFTSLIRPVYADIANDPELATTTFNNMPAFADGGTSLLNDPGIVGQIGYDPSRSWSAGSLPKDVVLTGDLYQFGVGDKTVQDLVGNREVTLGEFSAINGESIESIAEAIPELKNMPVSAIPAFEAIASGAGGDYQRGVLTAVNAYVPGAKQFLADNPWASQIPVNSLIQGDWKGALKGGAAIGLGKLVKAYPGLKNVPFGDLAGNLIEGDLRGAIGVGVQYGGKLLVKELIKEFPGLSKLPLGELLDTKNLSINSIPGLATTALSKFPNIANKSIGSIPGLGNIPLKDILNLGNLLRMGFADVDIIYGTETESPATYPISGSTKDDNFVPVPCVGKCPHFELANGKNVFGMNLNGRQWVTKAQKVPGGRGLLGKFSGGKEPTGLTPWGPSANLKLVVESVDENKGVTLALYWRFCKKLLFADLGCSPYILGPIPFGTVKELGKVLIATSAAPPKVNLPNVGSVDGVNCFLPATPKKKYGYSAYPGAQANELVSVPNSMNRTEKLHKDAATAFDKMRSAASSQGIDLTLISGHRSVEVQQQLWDAQVAKLGSEVEAAKISAPPGYSEHQTGYAFDVGTNDTRTNLEQSFKGTAAYGWLKKNAGQYGFVQSYTGEQGQGADEEPWHWRYEGDAKAKETFNPTASPGTYNCAGNTTGANDCTVYKGVHLGAFKDAIAKIESPGIGHSAIGPMLSPVKKDPFYQVALGKYQFMTFRKEVVDEVTKNQGYGWLQSIWTGRRPTSEEVLRYFPPDAQERVMSAEVSSLLDQAQQRGASPNDYARTAAMIHNGGAGYTEGSSWTPGGLTVGQYGNQVLNDYNAALPSAQRKCQEAQAIASANPNNPGGSTGSFSNPVPGAPISDEFDPSSNNWRNRPHRGIDAAGKFRSKVGAADGGRVDRVGVDDGWGNYVIVDHGNGYATLYAHLDSVSVREGQGVGKMDEIGKLGSTGRSTGPHLHLELIEGYKSGDVYSGYSIDPRTKIKF